MFATRPLARAIALLVVLLGLLVCGPAHAGKRSMIPPGQEPQIREFVEAALASARTADELPVTVTERVSIAIDRDRIRVILEPTEPSAAALPRLVVFHPNAVADDAGDALAPGVILECGPFELPTSCPSASVTAWMPVARRLADGRAPFVDVIWQVSETGVQSRDSDEPEPERSSIAVGLDRGAVIVAALLGLWLIVGAARRRGFAARVGKLELAGLLGLLALFVIASLNVTSMLPLHEHNSFIARSDCAIDPRCTNDPAGAWSMTTLHGYGMLLERIPYRAGAVARLSLAVSVVMLALVWGLTRRLTIELDRPQLAAVAGLSAVAVLASNPVVWRLSGAATLWPWTLCWLLAAALAGLEAARACASEHRRERVRGSAAWLLASICLAHACAGNLVCLSLGALLVLAPVSWTRTTNPREAVVRGLGIGLLAAGVFALLVAPDYIDGYATAFGPTGLDDSVTLVRMLGDLNPLLLDPSLTTPIWAIATATACVLALVVRARTGAGTKAPLRTLRLLAPLIYAYLVPAGFLGLAAGDLVGSGYPVGFINHHWELVFTAIAVGLALAWLVDSLEQLRPSTARPRWRAWATLIPATLTVAALALAPLAREGWRMATGERVLERELVALERSFTELPEHDLLVVAPRLLEPLTDAPTSWDPLEVVFPVGFYEYAMRERGLEPALVVDFEHVPQPRPGERILLYLGSSLRSFQPHEIAAGEVPDQLERPVLARLRDDWTLEPVLEFVIETEQHEAISQRLGADRVDELELGFYSMLH